MPEINLPTAAKQDSIKQTVEGIASNFPLEISGGTDFQSGVWGYGTLDTTISQHFENSLVNIEGEGIVISITPGTDSSKGISLQIDNGPIINLRNQGVRVLFAPFKNSLVVKSSAGGYAEGVSYILL